MLWAWAEPRAREVRHIPLWAAIPLTQACGSAKTPSPALSSGPAGSLPSASVRIPPTTSLPYTTLPAKSLCFSFSPLPSSKGTVKGDSAACGGDGHVTRVLWRCFWAQADLQHCEAHDTLLLTFSDFWWLNCATESFSWENTNKNCLRWQTYFRTDFSRLSQHSNIWYVLHSLTWYFYLLEVLNFLETTWG